MKRILIAEDNKELAKAYKSAIEKLGVEVENVDNAKRLASVSSGNYDLVLLNRVLGNVEIDRLLEKGELSFKAPVILISAHIDAERVAELMDKGVIADFWHKAEGIPGLINKIKWFERETRDVRDELIAFYNGVFGLQHDERKPVDRDIIAYSPDMVKAVSSALRFARSRGLNIMVIGEPGTGRSVLAEYILKHIDAKEILRVEKGEWGYLEKLEEAHLSVGYGREGKEAGFDAVFIEGLEELPKDEQNYLLTFARKEVPRFITTSTETIYKKLSDGSFSRELYQYLAGGIVYLPPLRKRLREEIALLIEHFLRQEEAERGVEIGLSEEAYRILINYPWPGNVVELKQRIKSAVASLKKDERLIRSTHLPEDMYSETIIRSRNEAVFNNFLQNLVAGLDFQAISYEEIKTMGEKLCLSLLAPFVEQAGGDIELLKKLLKTDKDLTKDPLIKKLLSN